LKATSASNVHNDLHNQLFYFNFNPDNDVSQMSSHSLRAEDIYLTYLVALVIYLVTSPFRYLLNRSNATSGL
jgi:hypothetical protein